MIYVYDVIAGLKLHEFFKRQRQFSVTSAVALEVIFVVAVEDLVVGEEGYAQRLVNKSCVEGMEDGRKGKCFAHVLKDGAQTLGLLLAIGKNVKVIAIRFELSEGGA